MKISLMPTKNVTEYATMVAHYLYLVDRELNWVETHANKTPTYVAEALPRLTSMVNVVGYFRGQDGMFHQFRPEFDSDPAAYDDLLGDLYRNEDQFEARLAVLISYVLADAEGSRLYRSAQTRYYLEYRGLN